MTFVIRCRAIIVDGDEMLVVSHTGKEEVLVLPGGHLDLGENIEAALTREMIEELGVAPLLGKLRYVNTFVQQNGTQSVEFFFLVNNAKDYRDLSSQQPSHAFELSSVSWVTKSDQRKFMPERVWQDFKNGLLLGDDVQFI